ncbi:MAG TPA: DUF4249 domain-containing protein [Bacteroidales bacterium]|nr:DUF4249 domain-containing protein [Bacteroidales bacterium]
MRRNRIIWFALPLLVLASCVKSYEPLIKSSDRSKYVVSGNITDAGGQQKVNVSMTSAIGDPEFIPVEGCLVMIRDDKGHDFDMTDSGNGDYFAIIDPAFLKAGVSFKVIIHIPDGTDIESDYDKMPECPEIDSVYFILQNLPTNDPEVFEHGIQFYVDLNGKETDSRFYRWEAIETYEYHARYPREWWYDGVIHHIWPPDYSRKVCWRTSLIENIYSLSTMNLAENRYKQFPLHFVDNKTTKLAYGYSLLVNQYALSEATYFYWEQLKNNTRNDGNLYEKQPVSIQGNLHNLTHPEIDVMGNFSAVSVKSKRIFIRNVENLELDFSDYCDPMRLERGLREIDPMEYPVFLMDGINGYHLVQLSPYCVDCLELGGTNVKPDFWPE